MQPDIDWARLALEFTVGTARGQAGNFRRSLPSEWVFGWHDHRYVPCIHGSILPASHGCRGVHGSTTRWLYPCYSHDGMGENKSITPFDTLLVKIWRHLLERPHGMTVLCGFGACFKTINSKCWIQEFPLWAVIEA